MNAYIRVWRADGRELPLRVKRCDTFGCRLRGLTFRRSLAEDEALLFVEASESRLGAAIHMLFVFMPIGVVWMDGGGLVVDKGVARPFVPYYAPRCPAQYFLEGPPALVDWVEIGEMLYLEPVQ